MKLRYGANTATPHVDIITLIEPATLAETSPEDFPSNP